MVVEVRGVLGVSWWWFALVVVVGYGSSREWFGGWWVSVMVQVYHGCVWCVLLGWGGSRC